MKRILCLLLALALMLGCTACGKSVGRASGMRIITTLVEQDYSLAFRVDDPTQKYVDAALQENAELEYDVAHAGDPETIESIARTKLGLVMPGEKIFYDVGN